MPKSMKRKSPPEKTDKRDMTGAPRNRPKRNLFVEFIRKKEVELFPEFREHDIISPPLIRSMYFAPSWHFRKGLLTKEIIQDILVNRRMVLSVGAGAAHLERLITKVFGIPASQIVLADREPAMPQGFEHHIYDMYSKWPDFGNKFDYVLFPECILLYAQFDEESDRMRKAYSLVESALGALKMQGQIRILGAFGSMVDHILYVFRKRIGREHPDTRMIHVPGEYDGLVVLEKRSEYTS
jgi:hypothetical protein